MDISDALSLMLTFGMFLIALLWKAIHKAAYV